MAPREKIVASNATPEERAAEDARSKIRAAKRAKQWAERTPSLDELWALLKAKGVVTQEDLP